MKININISSRLLSSNTDFANLNSSKFEFHIAKKIRDKYGFGEELFSLNGNVILTDFRSVRLFVQKVNERREPENHVYAGQVNAAGLLDEIYHFIFRLYELEINKGVFKKAYNYLNQNLGEDETRKLLYDFISLFPPVDVYNGKVSTFDYLNSFSEERSNIEITIEEIILLYFANFNPANKKLKELFDENYLADKTLYAKFIANLDNFFLNEEKFGPDKQDIFTLLKTPILNNPENIEAQLEFIKEKWGILLEDKFLKRLLTFKDLIKEDFRFDTSGGGGGAPTVAPKYQSKMDDSDFLSLGKSGYKYTLDSWKDYHEPENFTPDTDWMPRVVIIAKNTYVWLDQLSKKYSRSIKTLDQIPDEELAQLANWNFNGLWLIGIWERSSASKKIKHVMGNIDAVSSAYSLYDYEIAHDLGGELAYQNLNERARKFGIRLASDMVPNHTGIYSKWVIENPNYFIQSHYPPFPNYSFNGPDLSEDSTVQIKIEDGYWSKNDAAVVFRRIDNRTGDTRYIYHGNDGTNMPWNDTAQLNMLIKEVREAVIQKIFDVARRFSIIRFDAAMTLAKRHFSRLWFPEPGRGGDIPSRADYSMTKEEFDHHFPIEFWREVVDRINTEMPQTLLLAEAFWLMEGYFVRSLGMHRVYNSAFMHMMMKEENEKYRDAISNTLEFEPEILKRYVNFMSNPDEETAIKQFGADDKYIGVCLVMITLPGLPMFAHGQIEGYTEKYGMEYQRAYYNETPNQWLVDRHINEIFPLMKKRYLFSQVTNFWLFDFINNYGNINENVFAYTNSHYGERALVFYNNKYEDAHGKIYLSSSKLVGEGSSKHLRTITISQALNLSGDPNSYSIYRNYLTNLEYIRRSGEIINDGFYIELGAFKSAVFLDWREVQDTTGEWEKLYNKLSGNGSPNIVRAFYEAQLEEIHSAFLKLFDDKSLTGFIKKCVLDEDEAEKESIQYIEETYLNFLSAVADHFEISIKGEELGEKFEEKIVAVRKINRLVEHEYDLKSGILAKIIRHSIIISRQTNYHDNSIIFLLWFILSSTKEIFEEKGKINKENYFDVLLLDTPVRKILERLGRGTNDVEKELILLKLLLEHDSELVKVFTPLKISASKLIDDSLKECVLLNLINDSGVRTFLGVNEYENVVYYSKEQFEELLDWILTLNVLDIIQHDESESIDFLEAKKLKIENSIKCLEKLIDASRQSEYKLDKLESTICLINKDQD
jgi:glycosidase